MNAHLDTSPETTGANVVPKSFETMPAETFPCRGTPPKRSRSGTIRNSNNSGSDACDQRWYDASGWR